MPNNPLLSRTNVLGSGTVVLLIPLISKAPIWLLACGVHVIPRSVENAIIPRASLLKNQPPSMSLLGNTTSQYCVPACNTGCRVDKAVSKQWLHEASRKVVVRLQLSTSIEPGKPPLLDIKAKVN